jgi:hypothetical protein
MITVLRVFLPNERAWVFRWLFQIVFPRFLGRDCISRIQVIVTDGDSQEITQLDMAIERFFPQAMRVRCGWHIVDKGIKVTNARLLLLINQQRTNLSASFLIAPQAHWPSLRSIPTNRIANAKSITKVIRSWIYSFMNDSCETEAEYFVSKALLLRFIESAPVEHVFGPANVVKILEFFREHIETQETR